MKTLASKYLLCFLCLVATPACSLTVNPPRIPATPIPTYIPSTDVCDIVASEAFSEVKDLYQLPNIIQVIFDSPIANRGESFNEYDFDYNPSLPIKRFIVAGISPSYALIAIEQGGAAHSATATLYYLASQGASLVHTWSLNPIPYKGLPDELREVKNSIAAYCK